MAEPDYELSDFALRAQAKAWRALWDKLVTLDPQLRVDTGVTGIESALASLDRLLAAIPQQRAELAALPTLEAYRDTVFDGKAVWDEVRVRVDGIGITAAQVAVVLDAVARLARRASK